MKALKDKIYQLFLKTHLKTNENEIPKNIVLLVTNQRSGSTWLFDSLRTHPLIDLINSYAIFSALGLKGRRYPKDLSNLPDAKKKIEVSLYKCEKIPLFDITIGDNKNIEEQVYIEKIHPHFFNHNIDEFVLQLEKLRKTSNVMLIFQIRNPKDSLISFMNYKKRNPRWYSEYNSTKLMGFMLQEYNSIYRLSQCYPQSLIIDYRDLQTNFTHSLNVCYKEIIKYFDINYNTEDHLIKKIENITSRAKRQQYTNTFLNNKNIKENIGQYENFFREHAVLYGKINTTYELIKK